MDVFEFNGVQSDSLNIYIANIDSFTTDGVVDAGSEITFNTSKPSNDFKTFFNNPTYEKMYEFPFQIIKINSSTKLLEEITVEEQVILQRWLIRKDGYKYLRFISDDYKNIYFNCQISLQWVKIGSVIIGAELKVTCDAPFGYSALQTFTKTCADGDTFTIIDDSDEVGELYIDNFNIVCNSAATNLQIKNSMEYIYNPTENKVTLFENVILNESITMNGLKQITSSNTNISTRFNWNFPRLINLSNGITDTRENTFTVTGGSCSISISYRTIRKAVK